MISTQKPWTKEEAEKLYVLRSEGIPYSLIGLELNRSASSCKHKYNSTIWTAQPFYDNNKAKVDEILKRGHLESIVRSNEKRFQLDKIKTDIIADKITTAIQALPVAPKLVYKKSNEKKTNTPEDIGLIISDTHIGQSFTFEETGGISEYNIDIFKKRVENLKKATAEITELHSKLYKISNLHIFALGDIVAGMNSAGEWSNVYINMPIYDQMIAGFEAFSDMIYYWLGLFESITFYGISGNHGRGSRKGIEKEYVNWDYLCYNFLEARFKDNPRVKFICPKTWWILQTIKNHKFLMVHGDDLRGPNAISGLKNYEQKMVGLLKEIPHYTLAAHYHSIAEMTTNNGRLIVSGSFVGPDMYSLKSIQAGGKAEQRIFGIHEKRGITWSYNLDLDHER